VTTTEAVETTPEASTTTSLLQASCRLTLAGDVLWSEAEMKSHVVTSLAEALEVPQSHLRNVVLQFAGRRLAAGVRTLRVDYEILVEGAVKPLLQKVMDLTDASSDTFSRFSDSLAEDANIEIRSVELLDVPHVYTTERVATNLDGEQFQPEEAMVWFLAGAGVSLAAALAACVGGCMVGVVHVRCQKRRMERLNSLSSSQEFGDVVTAASTVAASDRVATDDISDGCCSPKGKASGKLGEVVRPAQTGKSSIRELLL